MTKRDILIIAGVYLLGLALTAWYVFGTQYLTVPDAVREFHLFQLMRGQDYWSVYNYATTADPQYALQVTCLFTTYIPAKISLLFPISPELFYKIYTVLLLPFLPVAVYALAIKFTGKIKAFIAAVFLMAWVSFLQGASTARTGIALTFYAVMLLLIFSPSMRTWLRYTLIAAAGVSIPLTHYTSGVLSAAIFAGVIMFSLYRREEWRYRRVFIIALSAVALATIVWCFIMTDNTLSAAFRGNGDSSMWMPDKMAQAVFGISAPNGDTSINYSYFLLAIAWLTVIITAFGLFKAVKNKTYPLEVRALGVLSAAACLLVLVLPPLSRTYGIERVYLQGLVVFGIFFTIGADALAGKLRLPGYALSAPVVVIYGIMMKIYGVIHSITGLD